MLLLKALRVFNLAGIGLTTAGRATGRLKGFKMTHKPRS